MNETKVITHSDKTLVADLNETGEDFRTEVFPYLDKAFRKAQDGFLEEAKENFEKANEAIKNLDPERSLFSRGGSLYKEEVFLFADVWKEIQMLETPREISCDEPAIKEMAVTELDI